MESRKVLRGILAGVEAVKAYRQRSSELSNAPASGVLVPGSEAERAAEPMPGASAGRSRAPQVLPPIIIRTSEKDWLARLTRAYRERAEVDLVDDAGVGIDPASQSLLQMGLSGKLTRREWTAVGISGGMTLFGAGLVVAALVDPDPTSKLGLLVASGALLALTGGFQTIHLLTREKPPSITISPRGIHIDWRD